MLTARNSVHKSAAFGRNCFSHRTGRKGDSPPVVLLASCQDASRLSKDDAIAELIPVENETLSVELNPAEDSLHEKKRAEKRRRQKEKRTKQNGKSDEQGADVPSRTLDSGELESPEDLRVSDDAVGAQKEDAIGLDLGDRSKSEALGLAFVKNDLSLSSSDVSECSESLSLEPDGCEGETGKPEPLESAASPSGGILLDPRSSVTDSSGVETSSDADVEHHTFSTNSSASSVKDHDIIDEAYVDCDAHGNLKSLQWDQNNDAEFTVVAKKKRARSTKLSEEHEGTSVQAFGSASCGYKPFRQDGFPLESNVSLASPVESTAVRSQRSFDGVESNSLLFLSQSQSLDIAIAQDSGTTVSMSSAVAIDDNGSTYTDDTSSDMGLSQFDFDDDYSSYLSKNNSDWTVVKPVRRTKSAAISSEAAAEDGKSVSLGTAKCSDSTAKGSIHVQPGATENSGGPKPAFGGQSQNSRYVNNREMGLKNFRSKEQRNSTQVGFSGAGTAHHSTPTNSRGGVDGNSNTVHRNLCRSSSANASAGFKGISRIPSTSIGNEKCRTDHYSDSNGPKNNSTEFKHVSAKSADAHSPQSSFFRKSRGSPAFCQRTQAVVEKFISMGKFDVEAAARYIEAEYQRIMTKHQKNPELVIIYDSSQDV